VVHQPQFPNATPPEAPLLIRPTLKLTVREKYEIVLVIGRETDTRRSKRKAVKKRRTFRNRSMISWVVKVRKRRDPRFEATAAAAAAADDVAKAIFPVILRIQKVDSIDCECRKCGRNRGLNVKAESPVWWCRYSYLETQHETSPLTRYEGSKIPLGCFENCKKIVQKEREGIIGKDNEMTELTIEGAKEAPLVVGLVTGHWALFLGSAGVTQTTCRTREKSQEYSRN